VSYDINVRPTVITDPAAYWARVEPWLAAVGRRQGVVKASDADIDFLARALDGGDPVEIAAGWVEEHGLGLAVVTLGAEGAAAVEPGGAVTRVPGFRTDVADTVGAGDTFMAGFLDARVGHGLDLEQ
ncbi:carbohydrate kinase, partial [Acinetobacter baumannii]|nr:carbohydrate kinase [Acinetobacter baumannii]